MISVWLRPPHPGDWHTHDDPVRKGLALSPLLSPCLFENTYNQYSSSLVLGPNQTRAAAGTAGRTSMADSQRAGTVSSTKARSHCVSDDNVCHYKKSQLFLTQVALKALRHSPICALGPLQTRFCFYFAAQVSKYPSKCVISVSSPLQPSLQSHLD